MFGWNKNRARAVVFAGLLSISLAGCGGAGATGTAVQSARTEASEVEQTGQLAVEKSAAPYNDTDTVIDLGAVADTSSDTESGSDSETVVATIANASADGALDTDEMFTERDLTQTADLSSATTISVRSGEDVSITQEGTYVLTGTASDVTVKVDADSSAKVQLVLSDLSIINADSAAIYVVSADKVFVTTAEGTTNVLATTGAFLPDGETNVDAVVFSKDDLVLNGLGTLEISSSDNGVSCKDDLKVTGGTYVVECQADALEANDNVLVADGDITIVSNKDGIHAENDEDSTTGNVYIAGGTISITASSDGIQATCVAQIDGGTVNATAAEGIEGTYVQINGGAITISASDDGVNATYKSDSLTPTIEVRGGELSVTMGAGDTDALDSNGDLLISGGNIDISAQFAFDFDGRGEMTGGTVTVNGSQVTELQNSMMGGGAGMRGGGDRGFGMDPGMGNMMGTGLA